MQRCRGRRGRSIQTFKSDKVLEITGKSNEMSKEIILQRQREEEPKNLQTDVFWLLSLLGISFTPLDLSSICFLTTERDLKQSRRQGKYLAKR